MGKKEMLDAQKQKVQELLNEAEKYYGKDDKRAAKILRQVLKFDKRNLRANLNLGAYCFKKRPAMATKYYQIALKECSGNRKEKSSVLSHLGGVISNRGNYEKARRLLTQSIKLDNRNLIGHLNLGITLQKLGASHKRPSRYLDDSNEHLNMVIQRLKRRKRLDEEQQEWLNHAIVNQVTTLRIKGEYNDALWENAIKIIGDYSQAIWERAAYHRNRGDYKKALALFDKVLSIEQPNPAPALLLDYSVTLMQMKRFREAVVVLTKLRQRKLKGERQDALINLALCYYQLKKFEKAWNIWNRIRKATVKVDPNLFSLEKEFAFKAKRYSVSLSAHEKLRRIGLLPDAEAYLWEKYRLLIAASELEKAAGTLIELVSISDKKRFTNELRRVRGLMVLEPSTRSQRR